MTRKPEKPDHISQEDWDSVDVPEVSDEDFAAARPFSEVHPELFEAWKRRKGRPKAEQPKVRFGLRIAPDIVDAVKASGKNYNARVEAILRDAIARGLL